MKNPNELSLNQMIILEDEYNKLNEEKENSMFLPNEEELHDRMDEVSRICRLLGYKFVFDSFSNRYSLVER